jgi:hypothetical protein
MFSAGFKRSARLRRSKDACHKSFKLLISWPFPLAVTGLHFFGAKLASPLFLVVPSGLKEGPDGRAAGARTQHLVWG